MANKRFVLDAQTACFAARFLAPQARRYDSSWMVIAMIGRIGYGYACAGRRRLMAPVLIHALVVVCCKTYNRFTSMPCLCSA